MMIKVGLISLGCAKNLIDSEIMIGSLTEAGMVMTSDPADADVMIVNTCSFILDAKKESLDAIYDIADARGGDPARADQKLVVAGCLSQRFSDSLPALMPEVDAFVGIDQVADMAGIVRSVLAQTRNPNEEGAQFVTPRSRYIPDYDTPRYLLTPGHSAYVKIAEGCNHTCSFCIIPQIRGRHRSRTTASIRKEVENLLAQGVKEINLISQDTTYFGMDRWEGERPNPRSQVSSANGESLSSLLRELNALEGDFWIRVLYTHPAHWSDELIQTFAECDKVLNYVDIPLQHISDPMLSAMKRETSGAYIRDLIARMRAGIPGLVIRTTFIVGFPGETEADFQELLQFIEDMRFERVGIFQYSKEEDTRAYTLSHQVHHMTKKSRWRRAMELQQIIAFEFNESLRGRSLKVLVDEPGRGRSYMDSIEIDGNVYVEESLETGTFATLQISDVKGYDLLAK